MSEVSGLAEEGEAGGAVKAKKDRREKKERKEKKGKTSKEDEDIDSTDATFPVAACVVEVGEHVGSIHASCEVDLPQSQKNTIEEVKERHEQELADLATEMHAHTEAVKASAGKGKKAKERVEAVEREAEQRSYILWCQQQEELELLLTHGKARTM